MTSAAQLPSHLVGHCCFISIHRFIEFMTNGFWLFVTLWKVNRIQKLPQIIWLHENRLFCKTCQACMQTICFGSYYKTNKFKIYHQRLFQIEQHQKNSSIHHIRWRTIRNYVKPHSKFIYENAQPLTHTQYEAAADTLRQVTNCLSKLKYIFNDITHGKLAPATHQSKLYSPLTVNTQSNVVGWARL